MGGLSDRAMIAKLNIRMMSFSERDKRVTSRVHNELLNTANEAGRWSKIKMKRDDLAQLISITDELRAYHQKMTRPFGDDGGRLLPVTLVFEYSKKVGELKRKFDTELDVLIGEPGKPGTWPAIVERQRERLGAEFNQNSYPTVEKLAKTFRIENTLQPVPDWSKIHDKDHVIFKIEEDTAKEIIDQAREYERIKLAESLDGMWMRALETINRMRDIGLAESSKVHATLFEKLEDESKMLRELNFTDDPDINTISDEIRDRLCGWSVKQVRKDPRLKRTLGLAAEAIGDKIRARMQTGLPIEKAA